MAEGKVAWIIGGGSGIGAAVAQKLADAGWRVAISGRRVEKLEAVAEGRDIKPFGLDVTDSDAVVRVIGELVDTYGRIDLTLFGAAAWQPRRVGDYALEPFSKIVDTNFMGVIRVANPLFAQARQAGRRTVCRDCIRCRLLWPAPFRRLLRHQSRVDQFARDYARRALRLEISLCR
ncbi:SDR family NAD(P)-dependent oxidoreductase [Devosia algicola]|uniref:SDR family NAD(P)-dependent oxidoreductase n=1 Tax=Devosia algicola TaxID=3026418 RepID=A0ABY7YPC9_9HYPH|nr:SDR family oxidoreductase [Devosia algicola]WDR03052.1 SDR family NAD(P)-dependent oxidoreductase [Devosia algicola]